jgi:hypothetical protein
MSRTQHKLESWLSTTETDETDETEPDGAKYRSAGQEPEGERLLDPPAGEECLNCGAVVDDDFARVLGDNDGRVHSCPDCASSWSDLRYEASDREHPTYCALAQGVPSDD